MKRLAFLIVTALVGLSVHSFADDKAVQKYRNYLPEQIDALPESVKKSDVPIMYLNAAATCNSPVGRDVIALWLNTLMYPGLGAFQEALLAYQKDLGEAPTGQLTVWQIYQLYYRSSMQAVTEPTFPMGFYSSKNENSAFVTGTMTILDEKAAFPVNYQKLKCFRSEGYCELNEVSVGFPSDKEWAYTISIMWPDTLYYKITNWGTETISAVYEGGASACRTTTLDLNFATKEFYAITKNLEKDCEVLGTKIDRLKKPRISQIVDGQKIIRDQYNDLLQKKRSFLSSEFRERFERVSEGKSDLQR